MGEPPQGSMLCQRPVPSSSFRQSAATHGDTHNHMTAESNNLIKLGTRDVVPAARMLARAFREYPLLTHAVPDAALRERAAFYFCQFDLYYCIRYGVVYATSAQMEGVARGYPRTTIQ